MVRKKSLVPAAFCAIACSSVAVGASVYPRAEFGGARPVNLSLATFRISPQILELKAGQRILLRVANDSPIAHDLTAPDFFARSQVSTGDQSKIRDGRIALQPHEGVVLALIPRVGRYAVKCSHPFHNMLGMHGVILVDQ